MASLASGTKVDAPIIVNVPRQLITGSTPSARYTSGPNNAELVAASLPSIPARPAPSALAGVAIAV